MKMTGAEIIIETLIQQGVDTVFGYPGGTVIEIYDALFRNQSRIRHILTAHEQGAAHAADGYARSTGKTGVVIATSGPGATNLVTGIATAYLDSTPLVAITGNVATSMIGRDSFQEVDIMGVTMPITKHNYIVTDISKLEDILREAFLIARSNRPGPVLVDVPKDIQLALCEYVDMPMVTGEEPPMPSANIFSKAVSIIKDSKRPFIYCGGGVVNSDASKALMDFSGKLDIPIGTSLMGLSAIPHDHPAFLGMCGMHGTYQSSKAMADADLIIAAGVRFSDRATGDKSKFAMGAKIIHIDIDPAEIDKNITSSLYLIGDMKDILSSLTASLSETRHEEWRQQIEQMKAHGSHEEAGFLGIHPKDVIKTGREVLGDDIIVATDVGQHQMWAAQYMPLNKPRTFITSGGLGTMGFGMGAAIGACVANPGKRGLLLTGDGCFHMNLIELSTAVKLKVPLTIVIFNNGVLGMVRQWQTLFYEGRYSNTVLDQQTDFVKLAEAFGAKAVRVTSFDEIQSAYEKAAKCEGPFLIDCTINKDDRVLPMIPAGKSVDDVILN